MTFRLRIQLRRGPDGVDGAGEVRAAIAHSQSFPRNAPQTDRVPPPTGPTTTAPPVPPPTLIPRLPDPDFNKFGHGISLLGGWFPTYVEILTIVVLIVAIGWRTPRGRLLGVPPRRGSGGGGG